MTREQKIASGKVLREGGATYREVGEQLGVATATAYALLNPERVRPYRNGRAMNPERAKETDRKYRQGGGHCRPCPSCGQDMIKASSLCELCRADEVDRRAKLIVRWWAEGASGVEISTRLGWSKNHFSAEIHRLRGKGYHLPYRYKPRGRETFKFPEQAA